MNQYHLYKLNSKLVGDLLDQDMIQKQFYSYPAMIKLVNIKDTKRVTKLNFLFINKLYQYIDD